MQSKIHTSPSGRSYEAPSLGVGIVGQALNDVFSFRDAHDGYTGNLPDSSLQVAIVGTN